MTRPEVLELQSLVETILARIGTAAGIVGNWYAVPREFADKESFGDLDVVVLAQHKPLLLRGDFAAAVGAERTVDNSGNGGGVTSFLTGGRQLDLCWFTGDAMGLDAAVAFFSYSDFSGIASQMLRPFGLGLGHRGLFAIRPAPAHVPPHALASPGFKAHLVPLTKPVLTTDMREAYRFLGIPGHMLLPGRTKREAFEALLQLRFRTAAPAPPRKRRDRPMRVEFKNFSESMGDKGTPVRDVSEEALALFDCAGTSRACALARLNDALTAVASDRAAAACRRDMVSTFKDKHALTGVEVGRVMASLRHTFGPEPESLPRDDVLSHVASLVPRLRATMPIGGA